MLRVHSPVYGKAKERLAEVTSILPSGFWNSNSGIRFGSTYQLSQLIGSGFCDSLWKLKVILQARHS